MTEAVIVNEVISSITVDVTEGESLTAVEETGGVTIEYTEVVGVKGDPGGEWASTNW